MSEADELALALVQLMQAFRGVFDTEDGRWSADCEPEMVAACEVLEKYKRQTK